MGHRADKFTSGASDENVSLSLHLVVITEESDRNGPTEPEYLMTHFFYLHNIHFSPRNSL